MPSISLTNIRLHYTVAGDGPTVLLVHGLGSCGEDWEHQLPALVEQYRVLVIDLRGHGRSDKSARDYSMAAMASDVAELLSVLSIERVHAVGISMGGVVVLQLAAQYPNLISSAVIVNSAPEVFPPGTMSHRTIATRSALIWLLGLPRFGRILAEKLFPDPRHASVKQAFVMRFAMNNARRPYIASMRSVVTWRAAYAPSTLRCPILMVAGDQDYTPVSYKQYWTKRLPNAALEIVPGAHHALPAEYPDAFNRILLNFLATTTKTSATA